MLNRESNRSRLVAVRKALSFRARHLIRELTELFGTELARMGPNCTVDLSTSTPTCVQGPPAIGSKQNCTVVPQNNDSVINGLISKLWDNQQVQSAEDLDTESAAVNLGLVAQILCLISAILNLPIRHPFNLSEGYSRSTVTDQISPEFVDTARVFPLYLPRSSLVPSYRHAIALLNRNLAALRSLVGLSTPAERTTIWNLKNLLQHCLSTE
ncbi:unnamed protein product [Echinostoma caproni]|uniref:Uncharacterized protein n=1 Tax=Echinostoma caproni TaxID=27848 RepID=A0A183AJC3_9TREM|nr:unnamed protein product [Echinostoma caproni]